MTGVPIRVVIVDDHELFRDGIAALIAHAPGITVVGQAANADDALDVVIRDEPDVVLLDVEMPGARVTATLGRLKRIAPATRVIILTMHRDRILSEELLKAGATAFLTKSTPSTELIAAIRSASIAGGMAPPQKSSSTGELLSAREHEVLRLISHAHSNAEVATTLSISVGTVKRHTNSIYRKLNATSRLDAVRRASLLGIISSQ
ncbi:response regulator transcription factor [Leifsonia flava]|uniref:Response regulator transcription factor n=1 Tax=Orlajensenia leifsoniae TaxID=2561933 RepID=A0A4Y9R5P3_9MICO|nr:response regulator transcription factor [Leifsonia flava]TFV99899.1 response regulator transcription factor [Leifsonia flava]